MQRIAVESSDVVAVGYDPTVRILEVEFKEGRIYQYMEVPADEYRLLMKADSIGTHFQSFIMGHYRYKRLDAVDTHPKTAVLAFVTGNNRKFADLQTACEQYGIPLEQISLPVQEIQSHDPEEIAVAKAKHAYKLAKRPVVTNDTYWNILALKGFPGAFARYIDEWLSAEDILRLMDGKSDRTISAVDTLVYYDGARTKVFSQTHVGKVAETPRGRGLPFEQIIIINGEQKTIAEVREQEQRTCIDPDNNIWQDFAKWYNLQRRLGKA